MTTLCSCGSHKLATTPTGAKNHIKRGYTLLSPLVNAKQVQSTCKSSRCCSWIFHKQLLAGLAQVYGAALLERPPTAFAFSISRHARAMEAERTENPAAKRTTQRGSDPPKSQLRDMNFLPRWDPFRTESPQVRYATLAPTGPPIRSLGPLGLGGYSVSSTSRSVSDVVHQLTGQRFGRA